VLVADDYTDLLVAFKRLLAPSCEVVGCVADGDALFETMARLQPDVIVVDLFIPPSSGLEICRHIKHVAPETLVIIMSATSDADVVKQARRAGAFAFVTKAAAADDLVPAIQQSMATRSA
jgi:DNA-binding NarL/FixJ family response regulator